MRSASPAPSPDVKLTPVSTPVLRGPSGLEGEYKDDFPVRVINVVWFVANLLFQVFLTLRLDHVIPFTWWVKTPNHVSISSEIEMTSCSMYL